MKSCAAATPVLCAFIIFSPRAPTLVIPSPSQPKARTRENLQIYDRVGGGDSFASGLIYGLLSGKDPQWAVECGAAHGALAMTTPGDTTMATLSEVLQAMSSRTARIER